MRYCIIAPFLKINNFVLQLNDIHFSLLVLATLLIASAGYVINDYFDTRTDRLNRPEQVVIDRQIPRRYAMLMHLLMNFLGVGLGVYLSFYIKVPGLSIIFIITAGLLWFYSTNYKRQFLIGNILVSLMTASVPMLVILYEMPLLNKAYGLIMIRSHANFNYIFFWIAGFGYFAFIMTLLREIIKDTEDFEGDSAYGMNTLPIVLGIKSTKIILISLLCICIASLLWILLKFIFFNRDFTDYFSGGYFLLFLFTPLFILLIKLIIAKTKRDYYMASQLTKIIMLAGIFYAFIVRYIVIFKLN
jgi:4-hydroxybenzoate polyprenyltransferase